MPWSNDQFIGELTIPTGATTGARITINNNQDGAIKVYNSANVLIAEISATADVIAALDGTGSFAKLDPSAVNSVSFNPAPGLVLSRPTGDAEPASLTQYDDGFDHGLYIRSSSPVTPSVQGEDYASIQMIGRYSSDPQIIMNAGDATNPAGFIAINGTIFDFEGRIISYPAATVYTPAIGSTGGATFSTRTGWWYRVGPMVYFNAFAICNGAGAGAGLVQVTTPTTLDRTTRQRIGAHISGVAGGPGSGEYTALVFAGAGAATTIDRITRGGADLTGANVAVGMTMTIEGWYREFV